MTEQEWLACGDPQAMLDFVRGKPDKRQLRLFAAACCRRIWTVLPGRHYRRAVEVAEEYADRRAGEQQRRDAFARAETQSRRYSSGLGKLYVALMAATAVAAAVSRHHRLADDASAFAATAHAKGVWAAERRVESEAHARLLRDIFGNPFRPVTLDPRLVRWNDGTVVQLAQAAYEERQMPAGTLDATHLVLLADALEDAGCTERSILEHLRGPGYHVRGCWVVDLLIG